MRAWGKPVEERRRRRVKGGEGRERATGKRIDFNLNSGMNLRGGEELLKKPHKFAPKGFQCSVSLRRRPRAVGSFFDRHHLVFSR